MHDNEILKAADIDTLDSSEGRVKKVAFVVALVGILVVAGAGTAIAVQANSSLAQPSNAQGQPVAATATPQPGAATPAATPTGEAAPPATERVDAYGDRVYDHTTDPALIEYPASLTGDELANAKLWVTQRIITAQCMAEKGFDYTFKFHQETSPKDPQKAPYPVGSAGFEALYGTNPTDTGTYDWENAGCDGYAVHVTGQDGSN